MKILITGGCGFVGSSISLYLNRKLNNSTIYTLDNFSRKGSRIHHKRLISEKIKNFNINIVDHKKIMKLPKFDLVVDCCAEPAVSDSIKKPRKVFNTNLVGTYNIINKCIKDNSYLIFLSSSRIYSIKSLSKNISADGSIKKNIKKYLINESFDTRSPKSLYGFTKLASEELINEFNYSHKLKYIINRFGVISGPWQFGYEDQGFVSLWVINHFLKKKMKYIGFKGTGNQSRDVIHIDDVCDLIFQQIKKRKKIFNITFNAGGGLNNLISLKNLTKLCNEITGNIISFKKEKKTSLFDIPIYLTDNTKVTKYYKWKPKHTIKDIVKDIYNWSKENKTILNKLFK